MRERIRGKVNRHVVGIAIVMLITFLLCWLQPLFALDKMLTDFMWQRAEVTNSRIKIIKIDERSLEALGQYNTWTRDIPAQLVEALSADEENQPAVIAFDILYINEMDEEGDTRFAEACAEAGNVITAVNLVYDRSVGTDDSGEYYVDELHVNMVERSYDALREAVGEGFANTTQDKDGYIRQAIAYVETEEETIYSLAYKSYAAYMEYIGEEPQMPRLYQNNKFQFAFSGDSGDYESVSLCDVLDGTVDPRIFKDCIVVVGAYASGMQDSFHVAIQKSEQMYGVEIHANIIEALMEGKTAVPVNTALTAFLMALVVGLYCMLCRRMRPLSAALLGIAICIVELLLGTWLFRQGWVIHLVSLPIIMLTVYILSVIVNYLMELKKRREVVKAFKKYVAPQIVEEVSRSGEFNPVLGGERRDIAVLFVDIRGFTPMSEELPAEEVVEILNRYLTLTTEAIFRNGGTLDKFIGDATMAVFNSPFDLDDYVYRAVCTARDIVEGTKDMEKSMLERFGRKVNVGIGINCGSAIVGNIGCDFRMDYTAIGDTVNTASRLEGKAKKDQILIGEEVYKALHDRLKVTEMGRMHLKGKAHEIQVYSVDEVL
ncbi:MAG: adenylate/guanylate cyclase domain-containing protein [Lachnospiraceae bacterium]|nr:adenylate/guanylate cyclase domain-containing protein [Lachnospiraceae bacterium]